MQFFVCHRCTHKYIMFACVGVCGIFLIKLKIQIFFMKITIKLHLYAMSLLCACHVASDCAFALTASVLMWVYIYIQIFMLLVNYLKVI